MDIVRPTLWPPFFNRRPYVRARTNEAPKSPEPLTWWWRLTAYVNSFFGSSTEAPPSSPSPQRPLRVVIVGVHGWFPQAWLIQTLIGERVGTSEKFCQMSERAFAQVHGGEQASEVRTIAVEGDGTVDQRVALAFSQLAVHEDVLRQADVVFVAAHSQGTVVSALILHLLLAERQWIDARRQRVGWLCMAGILHGPFPQLREHLVVKYVETAPARELFEFCHGAPDGDAGVCGRLWAAVKMLLEHGVRMTVVGSWMDAVVPLYSSLMTAMDHPNVHRVLCVPPQVSASFLHHLLSTLIDRRNEGRDDHELLVHLSPYLQGALYGGNEHSDLLDFPEVFERGWQWLLGSGVKDSAAAIGVPVEYRPFEIPSRYNPAFIAWSLRGWLMDDAEARKLFTQHFHEWRPESKQAKELKWRMMPAGNGGRAKL